METDFSHICPNLPNIWSCVSVSFVFTVCGLNILVVCSFWSHVVILPSYCYKKMQYWSHLILKLLREINNKTCPHTVEKYFDIYVFCFVFLAVIRLNLVGFENIWFWGQHAWHSRTTDSSFIQETLCKTQNLQYISKYVSDSLTVSTEPPEGHGMNSLGLFLSITALVNVFFPIILKILSLTFTSATELVNQLF